MLSFIEKKQVNNSVLSAIKSVEKHDEKRNTVSVKELLSLSQQRYLLMQNIFASLRESLSKDIFIKNMFFGFDYQNEVGIHVVYEVNGKEDFFIISQFDMDSNIEVSYESAMDDHRDIVFANKDRIIQAFKDGINNNLEKHISIPSTSKHFLVGHNSNTLEITNNSLNKYFDMKFSYSYPEKELRVARNLKCCFPNIIDCLEKNETNLESFVQNVRVYEENIKYLIKRKKRK